MGKLIPMKQINRRLPEMGRIRFGEKVKTKGGKARPTATDVWILTTSDAESLEQLAGIYGGTVEPWTDAPTQGQFRLRTTSDWLRVLLHPDSLADSWYELWDGGGMKRRCDGEVCTGFPKDGEPVEVACPCAASGDIKCKPRTRLSVILPDVRLGGTWRMDTNGQAALRELPAAVDLINAASHVGFPEAILRLEHRQAQGGSKRFVVPVLGLDSSFDQLQDGVQVSRRLEPAKVAALEPVADVEVVDGEVLDEWT